MKFFDGLLVSILELLVKSSQKRVDLAKTPELKKGHFDYQASPKGTCFSIGFGKETIIPDDFKKSTYYIAGYGSNNPAKGIVDPMYANALWLDDNSGRGGMLFISLDAVGLLSSDVEKLKSFILNTTYDAGCRSVNVFCTHNHAGIDTLGLWGKPPFSGKKEKFMETLRQSVLVATERAIADKRSGKLFLGSVKVDDMQSDSRTPFVYSATLTRLRFVPDDGSREVYFTNFAAHSESLQGCNNLVSADFPGYFRERIFEKTGAEVLYTVGAIGGMISMKIEYEEKLRAEYRLFENTRKIGKKLADYALSITNEIELKPNVSIIRQEFYCPVDNSLLTLASMLGIISAKKYSLPSKKGKMALKTEISYMEIDALKILLLPGELFPELAYGGYLNAGESATGKPESANPPPLIETVGDKNLMIIGLANDEIGYIIPPNDFYLDQAKPYISDGYDRHSRKHYEETNSMGPQTAQYISDTLVEVMKTVESAKENSIK